MLAENTRHRDMRQDVMRRWPKRPISPAVSPLSASPPARPGVLYAIKRRQPRHLPFVIRRAQRRFIRLTLHRKHHSARRHAAILSSCLSPLRRRSATWRFNACFSLHRPPATPKAPDARTSLALRFAKSGTGAPLMPQRCACSSVSVRHRYAQEAGSRGASASRADTPCERSSCSRARYGGTLRRRETPPAAALNAQQTIASLPQAAATPQVEDARSPPRYAIWLIERGSSSPFFVYAAPPEVRTRTP